MIRALLLMALPVPALAAGFSPPPNCTTQVTVQSKECRVSHFYACEGDPAGEMWRLDADAEGPFFLTRTNREGEWLESHDITGVQRLAKRNDPASLSNLYATGMDRFDFWLEHEDGTRTHITGHDRLTGEDAVIDGQTLQWTEFAFAETDEAGTILRQARGEELVSREIGSFFAGPSEYGDGAGNWFPTDGRPMTFAFPGEPGFEAGVPIFECESMAS